MFVDWTRDSSQLLKLETYLSSALVKALIVESRMSNVAKNLFGATRNLFSFGDNYTLRKL